MKQTEPKVITKQEFKEMYYVEGAKNLSKRLGVSAPTLYSWLKKYGIPLKSEVKQIIIKDE